jgi:hypothetical protein
MDTISFRVRAPRGHYIASITYRQYGFGSVLRTGQAAGGSDWVVAGDAASLAMFAANPTLARTKDMTSAYRRSARVAITTALSAYATPALGSATSAITGAEVYVQVLPLPADYSDSDDEDDSES